MSDSETDTENTTSTHGSSDANGSALDGGGIDADERAGRSLGSDPKEAPSEETRREIEEDRKRRLDPDNRPENAEVDNTPRDFDVERGQFMDSEEYDASDPAPFKDPENPNTGDDEDKDNAAG